MSFDKSEEELKQILSLMPLSRTERRAQGLFLLKEQRPINEIADLLSVTRQTVYNWSQRFEGKTDLDLVESFLDASRSGRPVIANGAIDFYISSVIDDDPGQYGFFATTWTAELLRIYLKQAYQVEVSQKTIRRTLGRLGFRWKKPGYSLSRQAEHWRQAKGG